MHIHTHFKHTIYCFLVYLIISNKYNTKPIYYLMKCLWTPDRHIHTRFFLKFLPAQQSKHSLIGCLYLLQHYNFPSLYMFKHDNASVHKTNSMKKHCLPGLEW